MTSLMARAAGPVFAATLALATPAAAQNAPDVPTLMANGMGTVYVVPDIAVVSIGVTSRAATAADALAANSTDLNAVIAAVEAEGVAKGDIGTQGLSIFPVFEQPPEGQAQTDLPRIVGYQVTNEVRVTIRDIAASGGILDKVVAAGANQVNGITFDSSDRATPADAALADAVADARRQAEILAEAAGVRLVRITNISASSGMMEPMMMRMEASMSAAPPTPVMPGQRAVNANANVTWEIAPR